MAFVIQADLMASKTCPFSTTFEMAAENLDKGLDEIIASTGISMGSRSRARVSRGVKKARSGTSTKSLGKAAAAAARAQGHSSGGSDVKGKARGKAARPAAASSALQSGLAAGLLGNPLVSARRVVVSNLPLDINEQAVQQYFSESVGKIRKVVGSYRGDGSPSGTYTITFDKNGAASRMFDKFNNQPIDGGKSRLSVQILLDPSEGQQSTLKGRIGALSSAPDAAADAALSRKRRLTSKRGKPESAKPLKAVETKETKNPVKAKGKGTVKKAPRRTRSTADLDAEMSDYFANAEKNEISV